MARVRPFTGQQLEAIAKVIGDTETGLRGSEIGHILASAGIKDVFPDSTKWIRLYNAWVEDQNTTQMGNGVIKVITRAMAPIRYTTNHELFRRRQTDLNQVLVMCGMRLGDDGQVAEQRRPEWLALRRDADAIGMEWGWFDLGQKGCQAVTPATDASVATKEGMCAVLSDGAATAKVIHLLDNLVGR